MNEKKKKRPAKGGERRDDNYKHVIMRVFNRFQGGIYFNTVPSTIT